MSLFACDEPHPVGDAPGNERVAETSGFVERIFSAAAADDAPLCSAAADVSGTCCCLLFLASGRFCCEIGEVAADSVVASVVVGNEAFPEPGPAVSLSGSKPAAH